MNKHTVAFFSPIAPHTLPPTTTCRTGGSVSGARGDEDEGDESERGKEEQKKSSPSLSIQCTRVVVSDTIK